MPQTKNDPESRRLTARETQRAGGPVRQCAVSRERLPQARMVRLVRSPDGVAVPDVSGNLPGRGMWILAKRDVVEAAVAGPVFSRAFKAPTRPMEGLADGIEAQLVQRCIGLIGMARRGGNAVTGFDQVRASLRKRPPGWILEASDGAKDGRNKVQFLAKALYDRVNLAGALSSAELGMAFGRPSVVHGLLEDQPVAQAFGFAYRRLTGFRAAPERIWFADRRQRH